MAVRVCVFCVYTMFVDAIRGFLGPHGRPNEPASNFRRTLTLVKGDRRTTRRAGRLAKTAMPGRFASSFRGTRHNGPRAPFCAAIQKKPPPRPTVRGRLSKAGAEHQPPPIGRHALPAVKSTERLKLASLAPGVQATKRAQNWRDVRICMGSMCFILGS